MYVPKISVYLCACLNPQDNFLPENNTCTMHHHSSLIFFLFFSPPMQPTLYRGVCVWGRDTVTLSSTTSLGLAGRTRGGLPGTGHPIAQLKTGLENSQLRYWDCLIKAYEGLIWEFTLAPGHRREGPSESGRGVTLWSAAPCPAPPCSVQHLPVNVKLLHPVLLLHCGSSLLVQVSLSFFTKTKLSNCLHHLHTQLFHFICNHITHCSLH